MAVRKGHILRAARIVAAVAVWVTATYTLVSYAQTLPVLARWIARIQFFHAAMAFSLSTIVVWLIATLVFGRVYCSAACPLGVFQDVVARLTRLGHYGRRRQYHYSPPLNRWRNTSLCLIMVSILLGLSVVAVFADPWSVYSRACTFLVKPVWGLVLDAMSSQPVKIVTASVLGTIVAAVSIMAVGVLAARNGRTFCNSLCPVGTTLGYVSRYSIFHIDINTDKCIQCRRCEHVCKASCIDLTSHVVDSSRCVNCFDCLPVCPNDAIHYTWARHQLSIPMMQRIRPPMAQGAQCIQDCHDFVLGKPRKKPVPAADTATDVAAADINKNKENNNATIS